MLRKMILQGLVAAAMIGGAAALYAQTATSGGQIIAFNGDHTHDRDHGDRDDD